jgi:hypothetical protein
MENPYQTQDRLIAKLANEVANWRDLAKRITDTDTTIASVRYTDAHDKVRIDDYDNCRD